MQIRPIRGEDELEALATYAAPLQASPASHVAYLAVERDGLLAELRGTTWREVAAVAVDGDTIAGWLVGDVDGAMGRVWWQGPFVAGDAWEIVGGDLLSACRGRLAADVDEEEMAVDARARRIREWAATEGFVEEEGSFALVLGQPVAPPSMPIREIVAADHAAVAALHEQLFGGTHTTGRDLVVGHDDVHRRLVVEVDDQVAGYVAVELQPDGSGYVDYLGVEPAVRRRGLGADLVRAGVAELMRLGSTSIGLTVREGNVGARGMYMSLGFREERAVVPLRRGFSLA